MPLNIGLIGAGRMGSTLAHHLAFAVDSANLIAITDPYEDNARKTAAKCNVSNVYTDYQVLVARDSVLYRPMAVSLFSPLMPHQKGH
jgi:myo-inositol 2-dehydrogenase/D-chiro-inositol 1-dehydrogenase